MQQACVVLDAATFANAAPALRDLRLFQDGTELAYVVEESYDERALNSGVTPVDDRSEYEAVYVARMVPRSAAGVAGLSGSATVPSELYQRFILDGRVPVERLRINSSTPTAHEVTISARPLASGTAQPFEQERRKLDAEHVAWPFTLGANLQGQAEILLVDETSQRTESIILEMRRRSLCYQPRSASPLVLYLGGGEGMAAKVYGLANGFSTSLQRPYATLGPLEPNPDLQRGGKRRLSLLALATAFLLATLLVTLRVAVRVWRKERGRTRATPFV